MLNEYLDIRKDLIERGLNNQNAEDLKDYFVEVYQDIVHLTDQDLEEMLVGYRTFETTYPEYVQRGNALIAG